MADRRGGPTPLKVVRPTAAQKAFKLQDVFPDYHRHPFIRALARRYGFAGNGATGIDTLLREINRELHLEFVDHPFAEPEYDGERVIFTLEDFHRLSETELGFEFVHEFSHELQRRSGIDVFAQAYREWREQETEQRALRDSVRYLRYLGMEDETIRRFLLHRYNGLLRSEDIRSILQDTRGDRNS